MTQSGSSDSNLEEEALARLLQTASDRSEALIASLRDAPPADLPVAIHSTRDQFRMTLKTSGLAESNVSTEIQADHLLVKIRQSQSNRENDDQVQTTRFSSSIWERSFKLNFTPTPSRINVTVSPDGVTVTASRVA